MSGKRIVVIMVALILAVGGGVAYVARQAADERKRVKALQEQGGAAPAPSTSAPATTP
jgi:Flp pilus assembly protein CpaB